MPQLQALVTSGALRYVVDNSNLSSKPALLSWVSSNCQMVNVPGVAASTTNHTAARGPRDQQFSALYDCGS